MSIVLRILCLALLAYCMGARAQTTVAAFTPDGPVLQVGEAVARFSAPMVAFGDLRAAAPFAVDCATPGSGHWIDASTWRYDFARDLPGASLCRFTLVDGVRDLAGAPLGGQRAFTVRTGGPVVLEALPRADSPGIDEHQAFVLALAAPASAASIVQHAWCRADGVAEKIGVQLLAGTARLQALRQDRWFVGQFAAGGGRG